MGKYFRKGAQESPLVAQKMWWKSLTNRSFHPLQILPTCTTSTPATCKSFSPSRSTYPLPWGTSSLFTSSFLSSPSHVLTLPLLSIKFWGTKNIASPDSVTSLLPWFLPCIMPAILLVEILLFSSFLWQLYWDIILKTAITNHSLNPRIKLLCLTLTKHQDVAWTPNWIWRLTPNFRLSPNPSPGWRS